MLKSIKFVKDWRCFKAGETFEFRPGLNLLVGDQGTGKSSLVEVIKSMANKKPGLRDEAIKQAVQLEIEGSFPVGGFDFEKDNFRTQSHFNDGIDYMFKVQVHFKSHGQTNWKILDALEHTKGLIYLDEPDMALSIRSIQKLRKKIAEVATDTQILAVVQNPLMMEGLDVLSVEHRRWMPSTEFIRLHSES
jgi:predicted ATPase